MNKITTDYSKKITATKAKSKISQISDLDKLLNFHNLNISFTCLFHDLINLLNITLINAREADNNLRSPVLIKIFYQKYQLTPKIKQQIKQIFSQNKFALKLIIKNSEKTYQLLKYAHDLINNVPQKSLFSITKVINRSLKTFNYELNKAQIKVQLSNFNNCRYFGDRYKFEQIINNLIINAIDSLKTTTSQKRRIKCSCYKTKKHVIIKIEDNGPGIKSKNINKVFQLYFSTKSKTNFGIGLAIIKNIIENEFQGNIVVSSQENKKTIFTIKLPLNHKPHA